MKETIAVCITILLIVFVVQLSPRTEYVNVEVPQEKAIKDCVNNHGSYTATAYYGQFEAKCFYPERTVNL